MKQFIKYQHVERFGTDETSGIENGMCYIFPKIDGTNGSIWYSDGEMKAASRNRELTLDNDNQGFYNWAVLQMQTIGQFLLMHPDLRLFGEWLCLSGDTKIRMVSGGKRGHTMTLKEMYEYQETPIIEKSIYVKKDSTISETIRPSWWKRYGYPQCFSLFVNEDVIKPQRIAKIIYTGKKKVYEIKTRNGYSIKSTIDHKFYTNKGWLSLKDISVNDVVATTQLYNHRIKRRYGRGSRKISHIFKELKNNSVCQKCGAKTSLEVHHIDEDWKNNNADNLIVLCRECHLRSHSNITAINKKFNYDFDKVVSITYAGIEDCYDVSMGCEENSSSFVANGFVVHNCPHTLKTYQDSAWRKFYVFDVMNENDEYIPYDNYKELLDEFSIDYIPPICKIQNPTYERLINQLEKNNFLIKDGMGTGEGIVIKNYDYKNKYGRVTWAKIVKNEFKEAHSKVDVTELKEKKMVEEEIVAKFVTQALVEKEYSKIVNESGWTSKMIPRLLNTVYYCLIVEETWNFLKEFKHPTIDFKRLQFFTTNRIKQLMPNIF